MRDSALLLWGTLLLAAGHSLTLSAQETPVGEKWWPSPWGAEDERGAVRRITPAKVLEAAALIRQGRLYQLGRTYQSGMPLFGSRHYSLTIPGLRPGGPLGENRGVWNDELVSGEIGQIGTQFDGLGHVGVRVGDADIFYNGFQLADFGSPYGLRKLGVEKAGAFFTRGVLIDVARHRKVERLGAGYIITPGDIESVLEAQQVSIRPGDVVLFHTGHGLLWMKDNDQYNAGAPGIGLAAARWLADREIAMTGSDTWSTEAVPGDDPDRPFEVHQLLLTRHGIYNLENLNLEELARDRVYEFAFVFSPLKLKGATGSPGNPIAVR